MADQKKGNGGYTYHPVFPKTTEDNSKSMAKEACEKEKSELHAKKAEHNPGK